ncbi:Uncharacterized membrane protein YesL [Butyrivibrio hungatei DSM 14810]|uniref:Uncharacterized membrane protein YesL n=1 Tax=Butyrivibrio hungatei DSM 14810 TaxID=1121132 RepID=A0A1M7STX9_9FIRM|nr:DUF624 domain-containing protein [Butyrivibrio hungatei]SHN61912.1 Uncharacterized membrane protein YesL [Butyrivibrio hungatei DSM 14810]
MGKLFDLESPLMRALTRVADVMWLNILTLIFAIPLIIEQAVFLGPVFGPVMFDGAQLDYNYFLSAVLWAWIFGIICSSILGPACTAMHFVLLKIVRDEDSYITKTYFRSFKENFKQAVVLQIIKFTIGGVLVLDFFILNNLNGIYRYIIIGISAFLYMVSLYVFPILSKFDNTNRATLKNSLLMSILAFPKTILMTLITGLPLLIFYFFDVKSIPVLVLMGIAGPSFLNALLYNGTFKRFEPKEDELTEEEELDKAIRKLDEE